MSHLPSPPLSTSSAPPNPWWTPRQEDGLAHARQAMKLSIGSAAALDAAWLEGQPPESPSPPSPGDLSPPKGSPPAEPMLALQVLARVVDSSKGRDKFLVRPPPPRSVRRSPQDLEMHAVHTQDIHLPPLPRPQMSPPPQLPPPPRLPPRPHPHVPQDDAPPSPRPRRRHRRRHRLSRQDWPPQAQSRTARRSMGKVSLESRKNHPAHHLSSRFWLLTTLIALYKLHFHTIPRIQAYQAGQYGQPRISSERQVARRKPEQQLKEAKWTNRKLVADLLFVCTYPSSPVPTLLTQLDNCYSIRHLQPQLASLYPLRPRRTTEMYNRLGLRTHQVNCLLPTQEKTRR